MLRRNGSLLVLTLSLLLFVPPTADAQARRKPLHAVTFKSFGPVRVGMRVPAASRALGVRFRRGEEPEGDCYYVYPERGFEGVAFMVNGGRIARIDVHGGAYATDVGAKIGDTEARIKRLYKGRVKVSGHPYVDGHYLTVELKGTDYSIIFETDGGRVTSFRAGRYPAVGYIEGCS